MTEFNGFPEEALMEPLGKPWHVYVNGSSCWACRGVGVHHNTIKLAFKRMKNEAEYEALLAGLVTIRALGAIEVEVRADSQVVVNQV